MKIYNTILLLSFLFLYQSSTFAQNNYLPGYIIKSDGETVRGFIDFQEWKVNPKKIRFKSDESGKSRMMTLESINGFGIDNEESYVRRTVNLNISSVKLDGLTDSREPIFEERTVFLRVLASGKAHLYSLYDGVGKQHYFIEKDDLTIEELIYTKYFKTKAGKRYVAYFEQYKGQLSNALTDCGELFPMIKDAEYKEKDLTPIFEAYNVCSGSFNRIAKKEKKIQVKPGVLLGAGISKFGITGVTTTGLENMDFGFSHAYSAGISLDLISARSRGKYSIHNELIYNSIGASTHYEDITSDEVYTINDVKMDLGYLQLNTLFRYTVATPKLRPYLNTGIGNSILIRQVNEMRTERKFYSTESITDDKALADIRAYDFSIVSGLGITGSRFSSELRFEFGKRISPFIASSSNTKTVMLVIFYNLGKTK